MNTNHHLYMIGFILLMIIWVISFFIAYIMNEGIYRVYGIY